MSLNDFNPSCPGCDAQVVVHKSGWKCSICELDSEGYAQHLLMAADIMANERGWYEDMDVRR